MKLSETRPHLLLTVLGTECRETRYELGERQAGAPLAPIALLNLLPEEDRPRRVVALCTPQAKDKTLPLLQEGLSDQFEVEPIDVPTGHSQEETDGFLQAVSRAIPNEPKLDLTVDLTHGYRHFSVLTYTAVLYLTALRGVRLRGAYYGLLRPGEPSPFLDLQPLLALPRWFHALQVLRETGGTTAIASLLGQGAPGPSAQTIRQELLQLSKAYLSGLPLELGRQARAFCDQRRRPLRKLLRDDHRLPLAGELVHRLMDYLGRFHFPAEVPGDGWKGKTALSREELERQARLIEELWERGNLATALGLMNEWTVSWAAWRMGNVAEWLDYKRVRRRAATLLGALAAMLGDPDLDSVLSDEQRALAGYWSGLRDLRNAYHHHGMRPQVLVGNPQIERTLEEVGSYWRESLRSCPEFSLALADSHGGPMLVSPIGRRPGVLFSAVRVTRREVGEGPAACLVICSAETEPLIGEALARAGYQGSVERLALEDPYGGLAQIERIVKRARRSVVGADEVLVNVTGGTTLMGLVAEAIGTEARRLARPVRRFGLIDRRPPAQQDSDPYREGEAFWLDAEEDGDVDHD